MKKAQQQINATEPSISSNYNTLRKALTELYQISLMVLKAIVLDIFPYLYVICVTAIYVALIVRGVIGGAAC